MGQGAKVLENESSRELLGAKVFRSKKAMYHHNPFLTLGPCYNR